MAAATKLILLLGVAVNSIANAQNIDGGRSELPGMRQDMFDQAQRNKQRGGQAKMGKVPDCPKSDKMSPFYGLAFVSGEMYVKVDSTEGKCQRLLTLNGVNYTEMLNYSRTCGPAGEGKLRIAEELSAMFFQGGHDWPKGENETMEVVTEDGTFQLELQEAKYAEVEACWKRGCDCEQAKHPKTKAVLWTIGAIAIALLSMDSVKYAWEWMKGKKPPKHVVCKKDHRISEVKFTHSHCCDICGARGTQYQCCEKCNYDLCKKCYKEQKKKVKAKWAEWVEKHPEDKKKSKDEKDDEKDEDEDEKKATSGDEKNEGGRSEPESGTENKSGASSEGGDKEEDDSAAASTRDADSETTKE